MENNLHFHGLPEAGLHIAIHGFVLKNLQNRIMSTICKPPYPSANLLTYPVTISRHEKLLTTNTDGSLNKLVMVFAHCSQNKKLLPHFAPGPAPVHASSFVTGDLIAAPVKPCTATAAPVLLIE
jgi:hypothetical protein